jgi:superfamily II DNA or RNA helicase
MREYPADFRYEKNHQCEHREYQAEAVRAVLEQLSPVQPTLLHLATGGGKTFVANEVVAEHLRAGGRVLWFTKDWALLYQAAKDITRRFKGHKRKIGRLGGKNKDLRFLPERRTRRIHYSTLHTLTRRLADGLPITPTLVVWDECHWGEHAKVGRKILRYCAENNIPVLGLTATPRTPSTSRFKVAYSKTFEELVGDGYVAKPKLVDPVRTGRRWRPRLSSDHSDFAPRSLRELAQDGQRNRLIVNHYVKNARKYGKAIVFACNVRHANRLAELFERNGVKARAVHSRRSNSDNIESLQSFRNGEVQMLVNVAMLTHGVDVPDAKTLFLCRPTLSDILFAQMIGRGARVAEGKSYFYVVEFTDNLERFDKPPITARRFFHGAPFAEQTVLTVPAVRLRPAQHQYDPTGQPKWTPDSNDVPEAARDLWYVEKQTFGIEIELTKRGHARVRSREWLEVAGKLRDALAERLPDDVFASEVLTSYHAGGKDHRYWNIEPDSSAGWEVSSRILQDQDGLEEIARVCDTLSRVADDLGLSVNHRCGLHIHIGWQSADDEDLKAVLRLGKILEPGLATLVAPSRIARFSKRSGRWRYMLEKPNVFAKPISSVFPRSALLANQTVDSMVARAGRDRHVTINVSNINDSGTVEFRLPSGTTEAWKILLWVSLCQQMLWAASGPNDNDLECPEDRSAVSPSGDILKLATEYLSVDGHDGFRKRLHKRRLQVARIWNTHEDLRPWRFYRRAWRSPQPARGSRQ